MNPAELNIPVSLPVPALTCPFCRINRRTSRPLTHEAKLNDTKWIAICEEHESHLSRVQYSPGGPWARDPIATRVRKTDCQPTVKVYESVDALMEGTGVSEEVRQKVQDLTKDLKVYPSPAAMIADNTEAIGASYDELLTLGSLAAVVRAIDFDTLYAQLPEYRRETTPPLRVRTKPFHNRRHEPWRCLWLPRKNLIHHTHAKDGVSLRRLESFSPDIWVISEPVAGEWIETVALETLNGATGHCVWASWQTLRRGLTDRWNQSHGAVTLW